MASDDSSDYLSSVYDMIEQLDMADGDDFQYEMPANYNLECLNGKVKVPKTLNQFETESVKIKFENFSSYVPISVNEKSSKYLKHIPPELLEFIEQENIIKCTSSDDHIDLVVSCKPFLLLVSSDILKTRIDYFEACLSSKWGSKVGQRCSEVDHVNKTPGNYSIYKMSDVDFPPEALGSVLKWIHLGNIDLLDKTLEQCMNIFSICEMFGLKNCLIKVGQCIVLKLEYWLKTVSFFETPVDPAVDSVSENEWYNGFRINLYGNNKNGTYNRSEPTDAIDEVQDLQTRSVILCTFSNT